VLVQTTTDWPAPLFFLHSAPSTHPTRSSNRAATDCFLNRRSESLCFLRYLLFLVRWTKSRRYSENAFVTFLFAAFAIFCSNGFPPPRTFQLPRRHSTKPNIHHIFLNIIATSTATRRCAAPIALICSFVILKSQTSVYNPPTAHAEAQALSRQLLLDILVA